MSSKLTRCTRPLVVALAVGLMAVAPAAAAPARDVPAPNVRSPHVQDSARAVASGRIAIDLRSPDARDAASGTRAAAQQPVQGTRAGDRSTFDWGDAGIGAGAIVSLVLVALGGIVLAGHRRDERHAGGRGRHIAH